MMTSRSNTRLRWLLVTVLLLCAGVASAGRRRVVVLDFDGPKAEKFHADVIKLLKHHHQTVIPTDKWTGTANELNATGTSERDIKKVAEKLKVDGVIEGKIEKRHDRYIIKLKLRAGTSGELVGNPVDTHTEGAKLDHTAVKDIREQLIAAIEGLEVNHGRHHGDDEADSDSDSGSGSGSGDDDSDSDSSRHHGFSKHAEVGRDKVGDDDKAGDDDKTHERKHHGDDDTADSDSGSGSGDDDSHARKHEHGDDDGSSDDDHDRKHHKRVAHRGDDDEDTSAEAHSDDDTATTGDMLSPAHRAIDATVGLSFVARRLTFAYSSQLAGSQIPSGYKQSIPVAGAYVDATVYPLAIQHKNRGLLEGLGIELVYDRVLRISSQKSYPDAGTTKTTNLDTVSERYAIGPVFRYPLGKLALGGRVLYESQQFLIAQSLPNGMVGPVNGADIPNVQYSIGVIGAFARYALSDKLAIDGDASFLAVFNTGTATYDIGSTKYYGKATTSGEEVVGGVDYALTRNIFLRGEGRVETIGMKFKSDPGSLANNRDTDPMSQDVRSARDTYFGLMVLAGYTY